MIQIMEEILYSYSASDFRELFTSIPFSASFTSFEPFELSIQRSSETKEAESYLVNKMMTEQNLNISLSYIIN